MNYLLLVSLFIFFISSCSVISEDSMEIVKIKKASSMSNHKYSVYVISEYGDEMILLTNDRTKYKVGDKLKIVVNNETETKNNN
jgi:hypothetical protein